MNQQTDSPFHVWFANLHAREILNNPSYRVREPSYEDAIIFAALLYPIVIREECIILQIAHLNLLLVS